MKKTLLLAAARVAVLSAVNSAFAVEPLLSPKDPRYEQIARQLCEAQFKVAPHK